MILTVSFEDREYTYEIPMTQILQLLKTDITIADIELVVREALK